MLRFSFIFVFLVTVGEVFSSDQEDMSYWGPFLSFPEPSLELALPLERPLKAVTFGATPLPDPLPPRLSSDPLTRSTISPKACTANRIWLSNEQAPLERAHSFHAFLQEHPQKVSPEIYRWAALAYEDCGNSAYALIFYESMLQARGDQGRSHDYDEVASCYARLGKTLRAQSLRQEAERRRTVEFLSTLEDSDLDEEENALNKAEYLEFCLEDQDPTPAHYEAIAKAHLKLGNHERGAWFYDMMLKALGQEAIMRDALKAIDAHLKTGNGIRVSALQTAFALFPEV